MTNKHPTVNLTVTEKHPFSHCRSCDARILWFSVWMIKEQWEDAGSEKPYVQFNQVGHKERPCYCPYCGERELYIADFQSSGEKANE